MRARACSCVHLCMCKIHTNDPKPAQHSGSPPLQWFIKNGNTWLFKVFYINKTGTILGFAIYIYLLIYLIRATFYSQPDIKIGFKPRHTAKSSENSQVAASVLALIPRLLLPQKTSNSPKNLKTLPTFSPLSFALCKLFHKASYQLSSVKQQRLSNNVLLSQSPLQCKNAWNML